MPPGNVVLVNVGAFVPDMVILAVSMVSGASPVFLISTDIFLDWVISISPASMVPSCAINALL